MDDRYGTYRQIRAQRTWRPLGRMSWPRVILGAALLVLVFLMSGYVSGRLAENGRFHAAQTLMISPRWMETYKPNLKAFIEAGVLYEDGAYDAAREAFAVLAASDGASEREAAELMESLSALKLARQYYENGDAENAGAALTSVKEDVLPESDREEYRDLCTLLAPEPDGTA